VSQTVIVYALYFTVLVFSIVVHEVAHGYVALLRGDDTAKRLGRITLNPLPHIDLLGTIILPALMIILGTGIIFGWAKPVPINTRAFANPRRDMALVSASGPLSHFALAAISGLALLIFVHTPLAADISMRQTFFTFCAMMINVNVILGVLNIIPIPPLDGSKILYSLLPYNLALRYASLERVGFIIILVLIMSGIFWYVLAPVIKGLIYIFSMGLI
jgi:Zn-dependent protease